MPGCIFWPRRQRAVFPTSDAASSTPSTPKSAPSAVHVETILDTAGCLFAIAGTRYMAPPSKRDSTLPKTTELRLATVFNIPPGNPAKISYEYMRQCLDEYRSDDVFRDDFLACVVFHASRKLHISKDVIGFLKARGMKEYIVNSSPGYLPGPHVIVRQELREVWKLIDDINGTCMITLKPQRDPLGALEPFPIGSLNDQVLSFAIPSRIKSRTHSSSLAGLRILIKDNIDLKGIKTSVGNRAFYNTFPAKAKSAHCVQKLVDKGVVIVGKTKLNSFGNWEEPMEYTDYQAPWNPRADGYQSPGGSSSGSASAIAAYDFLDITLGTDTWGSITRPAHWCGCFGLRPSTGTISTNGIERYVESWDVPGILARDLKKCRDFAQEWLTFDKFEKTPKQFSSIIWPTDFWRIIKPEQVNKAKSFAQEAATKLNIKFEEISFEEYWKASPPSKEASSLPSFINPATAVLAYDVYHNSDEFRSRYRDLFHRAPYTTLQNERLWSIGEKITREQRDEGFAKINAYSKWFQQTVRTGDHANAIVILPIETAEPRYRDEFPK
ncbi:hypothetical protein ACHAQJ_003321 [Trichoderma viride]